jgi:hypothetical protein
MTSKIPKVFFGIEAQQEREQTFRRLKHSDESRATKVQGDTRTILDVAHGFILAKQTHIIYDVVQLSGQKYYVLFRNGCRKRYSSADSDRPAVG